MKTAKRSSFPVETEHLSQTHQKIVDLGNAILGDKEVLVRTIDDSDPMTRIARLDLESAKKLNGDVFYYGVNQAQRQIRELPDMQPAYPRELVRSAAAEVATHSLMSKTFLQRVFRRSYEQAVRTNAELAARDLHVTEDFVTMHRSANVLVSNDHGDVFDAVVSQVAMDGGVTYGDTSYVFRPTDLATSLEFYRNGFHDTPELSYAVATTSPELTTWGVFVGDPGNRLELPGQVTGMNVNQFAITMAVIHDQQLFLS